MTWVGSLWNNVLVTHTLVVLVYIFVKYYGISNSNFLFLMVRVSMSVRTLPAPCCRSLPG